MEGNVANCGFSRTLVFEGDVVKNDIAGKLYVLRRNYVIVAIDSQNLSDAVSGYLCLGPPRRRNLQKLRCS